MDSCGLLYGSVSKLFLKEKLIYFYLTRMHEEFIFRVNVCEIQETVAQNQI